LPPKILFIPKDLSALSFHNNSKLNNQYLTIWDLVITPVYLVILIFIAKRHRDKHYPVGNPLRKYYLPGLYVKFLGVVFIALVYQFYYGGGDTFNFFDHAKVINSSLNQSFSNWIDLILRKSPDTNPDLYQYTSQLYWYNDTPAYTVSVIAAIFGVLNATSYLPIALLFAFIAYTGLWAMYKTFFRIYPSLHAPLAIAFLFVPSVFVWGSAVFKDTICMFSLGWMTYSTFRIFVHKDFSIRNIFLLSLSFYLIALIKVYIILAFVPALSLWLLLTYSKKIQSPAIRWVMNLVFIGITIGGFLYFTQSFAKELNSYALDNLIKTAEKTKGWIAYVSERDQGSLYDIGQVDPTFTGIVSKFPAAVTVTLYRPFLWEVKNPLMLLSALESLTFLILTLVVFFKGGLIGTFKKIFKDPNLLFFFSYSLIFAFAVGISTGNFGTLSRYKIPCMPFFAALLLILYYQTKPQTVIAKRKNEKRLVRHLA
jgi:hypothetical protein